MAKIIFTEQAWSEYIFWQAQDRKTLKRINLLLKDIERGGFDGIGKPEPLKYRNGCWSRRIDEANRIVYQMSGDDIIIFQCKGHYDD